MQEYLRLLGSGVVNLANLPTEIYAVDEATAAYERLKGTDKPLLVVLRYPHREQSRDVSIQIAKPSPHSGKIGIALVGAGGFALGVHMPNLAKLNDRYDLKTVMSRTGPNAVMAARRFGAAKATTDFDEAVSDPQVDVVLIATRHDQHADLTLRALRAGKHVLVEKPLAITASQLDEIETYFREQRDTPVLMTGFNRRFSPAITAVRELLGKRSSPMIVNYRVNAGFIANDHWVHGPQGGGRNIGEACHFYDLFNALTASTFEKVEATSVVPTSDHWRRNDNFVANVRYADGSVCSLTYTALGDRSYAKERCEIYVNGQVIIIDDFKSVILSSKRKPVWSSWTIEKGHREELSVFADALRAGSWPITLQDQLMAMRIAFEVERQLAA
jgi:predicted dehydrogenase